MVSTSSNVSAASASRNRYARDRRTGSIRPGRAESRSSGTGAAGGTIGPLCGMETPGTSEVDIEVLSPVEGPPRLPSRAGSASRPSRRR